MIYQIFGEKDPPLICPWGTTLHKDLAIFLIISLGIKKAKSAKKSISIFSTDISENRCIKLTMPLARMCLVEQFSDGGKRPAITNATRPAPPSTHMHVQPPPPRRNSIPFKYKLMSIRLPRFCDISKWN